MDGLVVVAFGCVVFHAAETEICGVVDAPFACVGGCDGEHECVNVAKFAYLYFFQ